MKTAKPVRYDEIEGKTVAGAGFGFNAMIIAFTDGTVLALTAVEGHEGREIDFEQAREIDLTINRWASEAHEAGLLTDAEWQESLRARDARRVAQLESQIASIKASRPGP